MGLVSLPPQKVARATCWYYLYMYDIKNYKHKVALIVIIFVPSLFEGLLSNSKVIVSKNTRTYHKNISFELTP